MQASTVSLIIAPWNAPFTRTTPFGISSSEGSSSRPAAGVASTRSFGARTNHSFLNSQQIAWVADGNARRNAPSPRTTASDAPAGRKLSSTALLRAFRRNAPIGQFNHARQQIVVILSLFIRNSSFPVSISSVSPFFSGSPSNGRKSRRRRDRARSSPRTRRREPSCRPCARSPCRPRTPP